MIERYFVIRGYPRGSPSTAAAAKYWQGGKDWSSEREGAKRVLTEELENVLYHELLNAPMSNLEALPDHEIIY